MSEMDRVRATIVFFGEPRRIPKPGERVELHVSDGSWQGDFRCISGPVFEHGERRVWVSTEEEYETARREGRAPAGDTWPVSQIAPRDEEY